jgi:phosphotransferase system  glucose/maltose/N-acetylglucosamine-specific IIC component
MQYLIGFLLVGAIALMITTGSNGLITYMIDGTSTSSFMVRAGWPIGIALAVVVAVIFKVIRGKKKPQ